MTWSATGIPRTITVAAASGGLAVGFPLPFAGSAEAADAGAEVPAVHRDEELKRDHQRLRQRTGFVVLGAAGRGEHGRPFAGAAFRGQIEPHPDAARRAGPEGAEGVGAREGAAVEIDREAKSEREWIAVGEELVADGAAPPPPTENAQGRSRRRRRRR